MLWSQVVGHDKEGAMIRKQITQGVLPHSLLITGPDGCGKLAFAMATVRYLFCENPSEIESCNACDTCRKIDKLILADLHFTYPFYAKGSNSTAADFIKEWRTFVKQTPYGNLQEWYKTLEIDNKQGNINKDECLRILKILTMKAYEGRQKVSMICYPEFLGKEGNRLLKILEEPPQDTYFILLSNQPDEILNTISSRCQSLALGKIAQEDIYVFLKNQQNIEEQRAQMIAYIADGDISLAHELARNEEVPNSHEWIGWLRLLYKGNGRDLKIWVDQFDQKTKEAQKNFVQYGLNFLRELIHGKFIQPYQPKILEKERRSFDGLKDLLSLEQIKQMVNLLNDGVYYLERNAHAKILMMHTGIQMHKIMQSGKQ